MECPDAPPALLRVHAIGKVDAAWGGKELTLFCRRVSTGEPLRVPLRGTQYIDVRVTGASDPWGALDAFLAATHRQVLSMERVELANPLAAGETISLFRLWCKNESTVKALRVAMLAALGRPKSLHEDEEDEVPVDEGPVQTTLDGAHRPRGVKRPSPPHVPPPRAIVEGVTFEPYNSNMSGAEQFMLRSNWTSGCPLVMEAAGPVDTLPEVEDTYPLVELVAAMDIEVGTRPGRGFPGVERARQADAAPVVCISVVASVLRDGEAVHSWGVTWALADMTREYTLPMVAEGAGGLIAEFTVHESPREEDLILAFTQWVSTHSPEKLLTYNGHAFDYRYLIARADFLGLPPLKFNGEPLEMEERVYQSRALGQQTEYRASPQGVLLMDGYLEFRKKKFPPSSVPERGKKLSDFVALYTSDGEQKQGHRVQIDNLYATIHDASLREEMAIYCTSDAALVTVVYLRTGRFRTITEFSRVAVVPPAAVVNRGVSYWGAVALRRAKDHQGRAYAFEDTCLVPRECEPYTGATVLVPQRGFHDAPAALLDFAGLYPSIVMAYNICFSTLTRRDAMRPGVDYMELPGCPDFVTRTDIRGILPRIVDRFVTQRREVRALIPTAPKALAVVYEARQKALKESANSIYGVCGFTSALVYAVHVARTITGIGRSMIGTSRDTVHALAPLLPCTPVVIYGDTDSVFARWDHLGATRERPERALVLGSVVERYFKLSGIFPPPNVLECEGMLWNLSLENKKRYAALKMTWKIPQGEPVDRMARALLEGRIVTLAELDAVPVEAIREVKYIKGLAVVRGGNAEVVTRALSDVLDAQLYHGRRAALKCRDEWIDRFRDPALPLDDFAMSARLSQPIHTYKTKAVHVAAIQRATHDPRVERTQLPSVGDRVRYIMAGGVGAKSLAGDRAWLLSHAELCHVAPDVDWYIHDRFLPELERLLIPPSCAPRRDRQLTLPFGK